MTPGPSAALLGMKGMKGGVWLRGQEPGLPGNHGPQASRSENQQVRRLRGLGVEPSAAGTRSSTFRLNTCPDRVPCRIGAGPPGRGSVAQGFSGCLFFCRW